MLHTTALGMNDSETAALALRHLKGVAAMVVDFADALPSVVLDELRMEGATVDPVSAPADPSRSRLALDGGLELLGRTFATRSAVLR